MAFVRLPDDVRGFATRHATGRIVSFEFSVFAGEAISVSRSDEERTNRRRGAPRPDGRRTLRLSSPETDKQFAFATLPEDLVFEGDMAAVIAVMPSDGRNGPIVGVANLDVDERVDFRGRESEILRMITGERRDYRRGGALRAAWARATAVSALLGGGGFVAAAYLRQPELAAATFPTALETLLRGRAGDALAMVADRAWSFETGAIAMAATVAALLYAGFRARSRVKRKARAQSAALAKFWGRVGRALSVVADRREAYRPLETVRRAQKPALSGPLLTPSRLLPPPRPTRSQAETAVSNRNTRRAEPARRRRVDAESWDAMAAERAARPTARGRVQAGVDRLNARERVRAGAAPAGDDDRFEARLPPEREPAGRAMRALDEVERRSAGRARRDANLQARLDALRAHRRTAQSRAARRDAVLLDTPAQSAAPRRGPALDDVDMYERDGGRRPAPRYDEAYADEDAAYGGGPTAEWEAGAGWDDADVDARRAEPQVTWDAAPRGPRRDDRERGPRFFEPGFSDDHPDPSPRPGRRFG
ncbi:MAG: hypothetical protein AAF909_09315 [Pseudomonadota bacterium]